MPKYLTTQKHERTFSIIGFASMLKLGFFWRNLLQICILCSMAIHCHFIVQSISPGPHSIKEECVFHDDTMFKGNNWRAWRFYSWCICGDVHWQRNMGYTRPIYIVFGTHSELYVLEQFHDYRIIDGRSVVEQAHKLHILMKELENFGYVVREVCGGLTQGLIFICMLIFICFICIRFKEVPPCWWGIERVQLFMVLVKSIRIFLWERPCN